MDRITTSSRNPHFLATNDADHSKDEGSADSDDGLPLLEQNFNHISLEESVSAHDIKFDAFEAQVEDAKVENYQVDESEVDEVVVSDPQVDKSDVDDA
ncbi:hypothetical protein Tco_0209070 [Tanacetum coccineum]